MKKKATQKAGKVFYNSTVSQCRYGLFAPVQKISNKSKLLPGKILCGDMEISFSKVLTQVHQDIIFALFSFYEVRAKKRDSDSVSILYSPAELLKKLGLKGENYKWLQSKIKEISDTDFKIKFTSDKQVIKIAEKIINTTAVSKIKNDKSSLKHSFCYVHFGHIFSNYFSIDVNMRISDNALKSTFEVKNGAIKAVIKYILTSSTKNFRFNMSIRKVLTEIGAINESTPMRTIRDLTKQIHDAKTFLKENFGIIVDNDCIFYKPAKPLVYFRNIDDVEKEIAGKKFITYDKENPDSWSWL